MVCYLINHIQLILKYDPYLLKRWLVGRLIGTPFKLFNGPIADPFNVVDFIYTYLPNETIKYNSKKLIKIAFPNQILVVIIC